MVRIPTRAPLVVAPVLVLTLVAPARSDEAGDAFARLRASDDLLARGRLGQAYSGFLDLARRYPTWWAPVLKAAVVAKALGLGRESWSGAVERAAALAPEEPFVRFVAALVEGERSSEPVQAGQRARQVVRSGGEGDLSPQDLSVRLAMALGKRLEQAGRRDEAVREYRWIAGRCSRCVAAWWRLKALSPEDTAGGFADRGLFPPRWRKAVGPGDGGGSGTRMRKSY